MGGGIPFLGQEGAGDGSVQEGESPSVVGQWVGGSPSWEGLGQEGEGDGPVQEGESPSVVSQWEGDPLLGPGGSGRWPSTRGGKSLSSKSVVGGSPSWARREREMAQYKKGKVPQ